MIKLSEYASKKGIAYQTAWRHFKKGRIPYPTEQLPSGTVLVDYEESCSAEAKGNAAIYARVSSSENKGELDKQAERLESYAMAKGYTIRHVVKEVSSGLNDNRKKLAALLTKEDYEVLIVEHSSRLARFGTAYMESLLRRSGVTLDIVNRTTDKTDDLMTDLVAILTSFSVRLYGQRKGKQKIEQIIATLKDNKI